VEARGLTQTDLRKHWPEIPQRISQNQSNRYHYNPPTTYCGRGGGRGEYPYKKRLNVLTALAIAGGPTYRANRSTVQIQRHGETGMREYPISVTVPILPGDVIRVSERYF
jgi:hypothetical protein